MGQPHQPFDVAAFASRVVAVLDDVVDAHGRDLEPLGPDVGGLLDEARALVSGGKRLRAAFCWWGARAVAGRAGGAPVPDDALLRACAALELLHASALAHDDLMDASDTRRGRPATHRAFADRHRDLGLRGSAEQHGAAAAILLGDLLLGWSDELVRRCGVAWERLGPALDVFDRCRTEVIAGQWLDVSVQARGRADVDAAMTVLRYKSARYSVERPLQLGAALAGADADALERLGRFGLPLGEAFQLRDDLPGVFGDPARTGKPAGDDLVEGKRTVLVALALDAAPPADARRLDAGLGTPLAPAEVDDLRQVVERSGARAQVEQVITDLAERAVATLDAGGFDPGATSALRDLAAAATQRAV